MTPYKGKPSPHRDKTFMQNKKMAKQKTPCEPTRENEAPSWTQKGTCALKRAEGEAKSTKGIPSRAHSGVSCKQKPNYKRTHSLGRTRI